MKIVVIDDDPTGSQTLHGCPLLLRWDVDVLRKGLRHPSPILFVLANTRALLPDAAAACNREICQSLQLAFAAEGLAPMDVLLVSRGDSTLRGHGVLEPQVINEELGPFDATLHVPAFLEGGRTTVNGVHLLDGVPVHTTSFALDKLFGYSTSDLASWLEEKSCGCIPATTVQRLSLAQLDGAAEPVAQRGGEGMRALLSWLGDLHDNQPTVVDAERPEQLAALGRAVEQLRGSKRFLFRSAASLLNGLANLGPQPLGAEGLVRMRRRDQLGVLLPGMVMVGSHVPLADVQLERLLEAPQCVGLELPVARLAQVLESSEADLLLADLERQWLAQLAVVLKSGRTPVLFSSRGELGFPSAVDRLRFGTALAQLMGRLAGALLPQLGYLISKGGITTHTLLAEGLGLVAVQLEGQLLPGLSLVRALTDGGQRQELPIVTFPGNLGDAQTLLDAWRLMEAC